MTAPAWSWGEPATEEHLRAGSNVKGRAHFYPADPAPAAAADATAGDLWPRADGQERAIEFIWPPEPWAPLDGPLSRALTICEWLDARCPRWEDAIYLAAVFGLLAVVVAAMVLWR